MFEFALRLIKDMIYLCYPYSAVILDYRKDLREDFNFIIRFYHKGTIYAFSKTFSSDDIRLNNKDSRYIACTVVNEFDTFMICHGFRM